MNASENIIVCKMTATFVPALMSKQFLLEPKLANHTADATALRVGTYTTRSSFHGDLFNRGNQYIGGWDKMGDWICLLWSNQQYVSTGSDTGLVPNRRLAIIWSNDDPVTNAYMRHPASISMSGNTLCVDGLRNHWFGEQLFAFLVFIRDLKC